MYLGLFALLDLWLVCWLKVVCQTMRGVLLFTGSAVCQTTRGVSNGLLLSVARRLYIFRLLVVHTAQIDDPKGYVLWDIAHIAHSPEP